MTWPIPPEVTEAISILDGAKPATFNNIGDFVNSCTDFEYYRSLLSEVRTDADLTCSWLASQRFADYKLPVPEDYKAPVSTEEIRSLVVNVSVYSNTLERLMVQPLDAPARNEFMSLVNNGLMGDYDSTIQQLKSTVKKFTPGIFTRRHVLPPPSPVLRLSGVKGDYDGKSSIAVVYFYCDAISDVMVLQDSTQIPLVNGKHRV